MAGQEVLKLALGELATVIADACRDKSFAAFVAKIYAEADRQKGCGQGRGQTSALRTSRLSNPSIDDE
jgi:hypothetical protein